MELVFGLGLLVTALAVLTLATSGFIIKKYEQYLTSLPVKKSLCLRTNFLSRKLFLVICSTIVAFLSIGITSQTLIGVKLLQIPQQDAQMTLLIQVFFSVLLLLYDLDVLLDKRGSRK